MNKLPNTQNQRLMAVGVVMLLIGAGGSGLIGTVTESSDPAPDTQPEVELPDHADSKVVTYSAPQHEDISKVSIYLTEGIVCTTPADNPSADPECTRDSEQALEHLNFIGFYEDHPDAPRPPTNESAS
jgi:hypothetical protein